MAIEFQTHFVFAVIAAAAFLFATNWLRLDIVAILVVLALMVSGVLTPAEAVAGFGDSVVLMVVCLLVIGEMLVRTGFAYRISGWIVRAGGESEARLVALLMAAAALLSGVMSSTAVVAIFIPIVVTIAQQKNLHVSRMLMPLSFGALIGGMLTLIATPPNLVVNSALQDAGLEPFHFFSFTVLGLVILAAGIVYMLTIGRQLAVGSEELPKISRPDRTIAQIADDFVLDRSMHVVRVLPGSALVGRTVANVALHSRYGVRILARKEPFAHRASNLVAVPPSWPIEAGCDLYVVGTSEATGQMAEQEQIECHTASDAEVAQLVNEMGVAVVLVHPESRLIGKKLEAAELWTQHGVHVLGVRRASEALTDLSDVSIASGDALLLGGEWERLSALGTPNHDFVALGFPAEMQNVAPARHKQPVAIAIVAAMVLASIWQPIPMLAIVMLAALVAVATRCLTMEDAYRSIHWSSIVLLAGMLPLAVALDKTGGVDLIVNGLIGQMGDSSPLALMSLLFWLTAILGLFLSNTATSVVMAPIGIQAAQALGVSPYPLAVAMVVAASAGFASPVSSPVVTLIVEPGRYRFIDFFRAGFPLMLLVYVIALLLIPRLFPF